MVVFSPQIYENYVLQSGEGLSTVFVVTWLIGDLCNLVGAVLGGLLPTMIILALYVSGFSRRCLGRRTGNKQSYSILSATLPS